MFGLGAGETARSIANPVSPKGPAGTFEGPIPVAPMRKFVKPNAPVTTAPVAATTITTGAVATAAIPVKPTAAIIPKAPLTVCPIFGPFEAIFGFVMLTAVLFGAG